MTFLLRKAEKDLFGDTERQRRQQRAKEDKETQAAEDASREMYRRYQALFRDFDFAQRALTPLKELSEEMKIEEDKSRATGFDFENITAYNKIIDKRQSAMAYNILAASLEDIDLLGNYDFTEKNEDGDVVLPPQVPPAPKKTTQERGELEEVEFDSERDSLSSLEVDENFSIFSEGDSSPKNIRRYKTKDKERKIKTNPEINLTQLFEEYRELATKTYDEFQDRKGETLTFEKAFLYLHYNRHGFLPENAKDSKIRQTDISRARKLASRRKRESKAQRGLGAAFLTYQNEPRKGERKSREEKEMAATKASIIEQKALNDSVLESLTLTVAAMDNNIRALEDKKGNIKALAKEAFERKLPEIKSIFEYEGRYENPLAEIFPNQPKTVSPKFVDPKELREERAKREAQRDMQRRVQSGEIDIKNPTSKGEKLLAKTNKKILDLLNEEKEKQQEVRETLRDAARFSNDLELAYKLIQKEENYLEFTLEKIQEDISNEENEEDQDKNALSLLKDVLKVRKEFNQSAKEYRKGMQDLASNILLSSKKLKKLKPKLKGLSTSKKEYEGVINELIETVMLGSFTNLGQKYRATKVKEKPKLELNQKEEAEEKNKLVLTLERDAKFKPLITDKEAKDVLKDTDDFIRRAFKLEDLTEGLENLVEKLDSLLEKEDALQDKLDKYYDKIASRREEEE